MDEPQEDLFQVGLGLGDRQQRYPLGAELAEELVQSVLAASRSVIRVDVLSASARAPAGSAPAKPCSSPAARTSNRSSANRASSSAVGRSAMICPSRMTAIRSDSSWAIASWWVVSTMVLPSPAARRVIQCRTVRAASTSRPRVGSSSRITGGSVISAAAIATFCCMPRE